MSVHIQRVCPFAVIKQQGLSVLSYFSTCGFRGVWFSCPVFTWPSDAVEDSADGAFFTASRDQIHRWSRHCCASFFTWFFLRSFRHHFTTIDMTEMADIEQRQQMIPFVTCEISFGWNVCESVFGLNVVDLNFWVQIDSIEQPIKSNSLGSGYVSHCRASSRYDHFDHRFVVLKHIQQSFLMRRVDVWGNKINIIQIIGHSLRLFTPMVRVGANNRSLRSIMVLSWVSKD